MVHTWGQPWVLFPRYFLGSFWDRVSHGSLTKLSRLSGLWTSRDLPNSTSASPRWDDRRAPPLYLAFYLGSGDLIQVLALARNMLYWLIHLPRFPPWILKRKSMLIYCMVGERWLLPPLGRSVAKISSLISNLLGISRQHVVLGTLQRSQVAAALHVAVVSFLILSLKDGVGLAVRRPRSLRAFL